MAFGGHLARYSWHLAWIFLKGCCFFLWAVFVKSNFLTWLILVQSPNRGKKHRLKDGAPNSSKGACGGPLLVGGFCSKSVCDYYRRGLKFPLIRTPKPGGLEIFDNFKKSKLHYHWKRVSFEHFLNHKLFEKFWKIFWIPFWIKI